MVWKAWRKRCDACAWTDICFRARDDESETFDGCEDTGGEREETRGSGGKECAGGLAVAAAAARQARVRHRDGYETRLSTSSRAARVLVER